MLVDAPNIELKGALKFTGDITHDGNMNTTGVHQDSIGFHTGATTANTEEWKWTTSLTDAANAGQVGLDNAVWVGAASVNLSMITNDGRDMTAVLSSIAAGDQLRVQAKADSTRFGLYQITDVPSPHGGWWAIPVVSASANGAVPTNNTLTTVTLIQTNTALLRIIAAMEQRIAALEGGQLS